MHAWSHLNVDRLCNYLPAFVKDLDLEVYCLFGHGFIPIRHVNPTHKTQPDYIIKIISNLGQILPN